MRELIQGDLFASLSGKEPGKANGKGRRKFISVAESRPHLIGEVDGWNPFAFSRCSAMVVMWKCPSGHHSYPKRIADRAKGQGCIYCASANGKVLPGWNDLKTKFPSIAADAFNFDPSLVMPGSVKKLTWKCPAKGHIYVTTPGHRTGQGNGCPYCSGQKVAVGETDLLTRFPAIGLEASGWNPSQVAPMSNKAREWRCPVGHIYSTSPSHRVGHGTGCPYCAGKRLLKGFNDIASTHAAIALEAHNWNPALYGKSDKRRMEWKCPKGHIYKTTIQSRCLQNTGCPFCAQSGFDIGAPGYLYMVEDGTRRKIGICNRITKRVLGDHRKSGWLNFQKIGPFPGIVIDAIETALVRGLVAKGIPLGKDAFREHFDGWTEAWNVVDMPEVATIGALVQFLEVDIDAVAIAAEAEMSLRQPHEWRVPTRKLIISLTCGQGHEYQITMANHRAGLGCQYCSGRKVLPGVTDFATKCPGLVGECDGWDPTAVYHRSRKKLPWVCREAGHRYRAAPARRADGSGCQQCFWEKGAGEMAKARAKAKALSGAASLLAQQPAISAEADGWSPAEFLPGSNQVMPWKCSAHGHTWLAPISRRTTSGAGCPYCSGHRVLAGFNSLADTHQAIAESADNWDPRTVTAGSGKVRDWRCEKGHRWSAPVCNRTNGNGCPVCAGKVLIRAENSLLAKAALLASEAHGWSPGDMSPSSNQKVPWKCCKCGNIWSARVSNRFHLRRGCPACGRASANEKLRLLGARRRERSAMAKVKRSRPPQLLSEAEHADQTTKEDANV